MQWAKQKQVGFTIVELLIVVVVIAILAAITIVSYNGITNRAKQSAALNESAQATKKVAYTATLNGGVYPAEAEFTTLTGLKNSEGKTYQYSVGADQKSYCLTTTKSNVSYYTTNLDSNPKAGACFGHAANGGAVITNLVVNPSFESNATGWTTSGNISTNYNTSGGIYGSSYYSGSRTGTAAIGIYSPLFAVSGGEQYAASMSARYPVNRSSTLRFRWYDNSGEISNVSSTGVVNTTGSWQTLTYSQTAPAGATGAKIEIVMTTVSAAVGDTLDIDGVMVVKGTTQYNYADGNTVGWVWSDTPDNSPSSGPPQS